MLLRIEDSHNQFHSNTLLPSTQRSLPVPKRRENYYIDKTAMMWVPLTLPWPEQYCCRIYQATGKIYEYSETQGEKKNLLFKSVLLVLGFKDPKPVQLIQ